MLELSILRKRGVMLLTTEKEKAAARARQKRYRESLKLDPEKAAKNRRAKRYASVKSFIRLHATIPEIAEIRELAAARHKQILKQNKK